MVIANIPYWKVKNLTAILFLGIGFSSPQAHAVLLVDLDASIDASVIRSGNEVQTWVNQGFGFSNYDATVTGGTVTYPANDFASGAAGLSFGVGDSQSTMEIMDATEADLFFDQSGASPAGFSVFVTATAENPSNVPQGWNDLISTISTVSGNGFYMRANQNSGTTGVSLGTDNVEIGNFLSDGDSYLLAFNYDAASGDYTFRAVNSRGIDESRSGTWTADDFGNGNSLNIGGFLNAGRFTDGSIGRVMIYDEVLNSSEFDSVVNNLETAYVVPEPQTYAVMVGLAALILVMFKRRRATD